MIVKKTFPAAVSAAALLLCACGYKGDLYLPQEGDQARFGPVQTGLQFDPVAPMPHTEPPAPIPSDE